MRTKFAGTVGAVLAVLAACTPVHLKEVAQKQVAPLEIEGERIPIALDSVRIRIPRGTHIGQFVNGLFCLRPGKIAWNAGRVTSRDIDLADRFYEEMTQADFDVVGDPDRLFDESTDYLRAEYRIGGVITDLKLNVCDKMMFRVPMGEDADAYLRVEWQVYSNHEHRVVYKTVTEGRGKTEDAIPGGITVAVDNAFAFAVGNLAADPKLRKLFTRTTEDVVAYRQDSIRETRDTIVIRRLETSSTPITDHINRLRAATVTVPLGDGHGSGFFISDDGLLLTNNHVVGEARFVNVRLISGREIVGEVLRRDPKRDVALVLVEGTLYPTLPIRETPVNVTEEVYAIGTPQLRTLSQTVSKGSVSGFRNGIRGVRGQQLIQADVDIHGGSSGGPLLDAKGNLVGISVAGLSSQGDAGKSSVGLNFFIPIMAALEKLDIEIDDRPRTYSAVKQLSRP